MITVYPEVCVPFTFDSEIIIGDPSNACKHVPMRACRDSVFLFTTCAVRFLFGSNVNAELNSANPIGCQLRVFSAPR